MVAPLRTPLFTALYALVGIGVAAAWLRLGLWWAVLLAIAVAGAVAVLAEHAADRNVLTKPLRALWLYEARAGFVGITSAFIGGFIVVATLWAGSVAGESDPQKTLVTTASAAVTSLLGGVFVSVKETDEVLGSHVREEFRSRFKDDMRIIAGSPIEKAIYSDFEGEWTDWSRGVRRKRVTAIQAFLDSL